MSKAEKTKQFIIEKTALCSIPKAIITSLSDITQATESLPGVFLI
jgi:hypothetical protein